MGLRPSSQCLPNRVVYCPPSQGSAESPHRSVAINLPFRSELKRRFAQFSNIWIVPVEQVYCIYDPSLGKGEKDLGASTASYGTQKGKPS
jgi:hypothetical protein